MKIPYDVFRECCCFCPPPARSLLVAFLSVCFSAGLLPSFRCRCRCVAVAVGGGRALLYYCTGNPGPQPNLLADRTCFGFPKGIYIALYSRSSGASNIVVTIPRYFSPRRWCLRIVTDGCSRRRCLSPPLPPPGRCESATPLAALDLACCLWGWLPEVLPSRWCTPVPVRQS